MIDQVWGFHILALWLSIPSSHILSKWHPLCSKQKKSHICQSFYSIKSCIYWISLQFLVKDQRLGVVLLNDFYENGVYTLPQSMVETSLTMVANMHERTSIDGWPKRLEHPSNKVVNHIVQLFSLPIKKWNDYFSCISCTIHKAHKQPFWPKVFKVMTHLI